MEGGKFLTSHVVIKQPPADPAFRRRDPVVGIEVSGWTCECASGLRSRNSLFIPYRHSLVDLIGQNGIEELIEGEDSSRYWEIQSFLGTERCKTVDEGPMQIDKRVGVGWNSARIEAVQRKGARPAFS